MPTLSQNNANTINKQIPKQAEHITQKAHTLSMAHKQTTQHPKTVVQHIFPNRHKTKQQLIQQYSIKHIPKHIQAIYRYKGVP